jgi:2-polyprenyl-6-methoxyphenol hydroxylase-like FAD-dependent oxidoreductase
LNGQADANDCTVLIAGAGPAGLSLAADLGRRGISCLVIEKRTRFTQHPRATLLGARSMEYFRQLGVADTIVNAGLPTHYRYDVVFATRVAGKLLYHYASPSPDEYAEMAGGTRPPSLDSLSTPYFKVQIGQHALEPILKKHVEGLDGVEVHYGTELLDFEDQGDGIQALVRDVATGEERRVRTSYLAACDGGRSIVRVKLEIPYTGRGAMRRNVSFLFRAPDFLEHATVGRGNLTFLFSPGNFGVFTQIDDAGTWNYQHYCLDDESDDFADPEAEIRAAIGRDCPIEVLRTMKWSHHQSVADRFRSGRVFLVGDSAHLFCPTGGVGMNTAIGDAFDLGWKIAAVEAGWGGAALLDSYEEERRPIAFRNTLAAAANADRIDSVMATIPANIEDDTPEAAAARERLKPRLRWLSKQFNSNGTHLGYRYADSPIVVADGSPEPPDDPRIVVPSTWPGARAPHLWVDKGISTLDLIEPRGFTLMLTGDGAAADPAPLCEAAAERCIPMHIVRVEGEAAATLFGLPLVLVRPDGHVAWRGAALPNDLGALLDIITGQ